MTARTLLPRTSTTAREWLAQQRCSSCGDLLPLGHPSPICNACREDAAGDIAREEAERILRMEQIAAARAHVRETLARWRIEDAALWGADPTPPLPWPLPDDSDPPGGDTVPGDGW